MNMLKSSRFRVGCIAYTEKNPDAISMGNEMYSDDGFSELQGSRLRSLKALGFLIGWQEMHMNGVALHCYWCWCCKYMKKMMNEWVLFNVFKMMILSRTWPVWSKYVGWALLMLHFFWHLDPSTVLSHVRILYNTWYVSLLMYTWYLFYCSDLHLSFFASRLTQPRTVNLKKLLGNYPYYLVGKMSNVNFQLPK